MRYKSSRHVVLSIAALHPEGLPAARLKVLSLAVWAVASTAYVNIVFCQETKKGCMSRVGRSTCECCGSTQTNYKLTKKGQVELERLNDL